MYEFMPRFELERPESHGIFSEEIFWPKFAENLEENTGEN